MAPVDVPVLEAAFAPFHPSDPVPPLAVQDVALLLVQVSEAACPLCSVLGLATNAVTLAAGDAGALTLTTTELLLLVPPAPLQLSV